MRFLFSLLILVLGFFPVAHAANSNANAPRVSEILLGTGTVSADVRGAYMPKKSKIVGMYYVGGDNITPSDTDNHLITLKVGTTAIATHSTALLGNGSLAANVPDAGTLSTTTANLLVPAGSYLWAALTVTGTYTVTDGKVIIVWYPL